MSLGDQELIKDNHVLAAGGITAAMRAVRAASPDVFSEVECAVLVLHS
ncbi:MAG: carboxylating nicotinate-nucleotide diphosphorylase [Actinomycetota bacterium]|nr:carboxylating nicotinate-nucleotide diphosphorylase [Actinomycetota bacterium]